MKPQKRKRSISKLQSKAGRYAGLKRLNKINDILGDPRKVYGYAWINGQLCSASSDMAHDGSYRLEFKPV